MDYLILFYFLISAIPGIYLATKKYFFVIPNEKYNTFFVRLIFSVPALTIYVLLLSLIPLLFDFFLEDFSDYLIGNFSRYIILGIPGFVSLITILFFEKYCIRKDMPFEFQADFMEHELYVYMPNQKIISNRKYKTKYVYPTEQKPKEFLIGTQCENLMMDFKILKNYDIVRTYNGEIVISENALNLFNSNNLSGFYTRPVKNNRKTSSIQEPIQLIPQYNLPKMASQTRICIVRVPWSKVNTRIKDWLLASYAHNDLIYYNKSVLENISDFNQSYEAFGSYDGFPYAPQKLWIVTNKVMKILIEDLNQNKKDFIPIHLVDDEI